MTSSYQVIRKMLRTEKGARISEAAHQYLFEVQSSANKISIKRAVEELYKVKVKAVNTIVMPSKPKLVRRNPGFTSEFKKAVVTLQPGQKIDWAG